MRALLFVSIDFSIISCCWSGGISSGLSAACLAPPPNGPRRCCRVPSVRRLGVVAGDELAPPAARSRLELGEIRLHAGDPAFDFAALRRQIRAEEQEPLVVAADRMGVGARAPQLCALALGRARRGAPAAARRGGYGGLQAGDSALCARACPAKRRPRLRPPRPGGILGRIRSSRLSPPSCRLWPRSVGAPSPRAKRLEYRMAAPTWQARSARLLRLFAARRHRLRKMEAPSPAASPPPLRSGIVGQWPNRSFARPTRPSSPSAICPTRSSARSRTASATCGCAASFRLSRRAFLGSRLFLLKDANARLDAVIWRTTLVRMRVKPEEGLEVVATGRLTTFPGKSSYQIVIDQLELAGLGALMALVEARRKSLAERACSTPRASGSRRTCPRWWASSPRHRRRHPRHPASALRPLSGEGGGVAGAGAGRHDRRGGGPGDRRLQCIARRWPDPRPDVLIVARGAARSRICGASTRRSPSGRSPAAQSRSSPPSATKPIGR